MVARPRSPDGNNVAITIKVSDRVAEALDAARGELSRSEWARETLMAALGTSPMAATTEDRPAPRKAPTRKPRSEPAAVEPPPPVADAFPAPRMPRWRG